MARKGLFLRFVKQNGQALYHIYIFVSVLEIQSVFVPRFHEWTDIQILFRFPLETHVRLRLLKRFCGKNSRMTADPSYILYNRSFGGRKNRKKEIKAGIGMR